MKIEEKTFNIGISCIGSGVGQSVINSLKLSRLPIKTIGFGTNPFAYGAYDCDFYDYTLSIYSPNYIDDLIQKCKQHQIDLLIPGLDDETLIYAQNADKLKNAGVNAIFSNRKMIEVCRDKEAMSLQLNKIIDVFVKCYNPKTLKEEIAKGAIGFPLIAKPRGGYASRGIEIIKNIEDLRKITNDHIIQELAIPDEADPNYDFFIQQLNKNINSQVSEVSIQIIFDQEGNLLGKMLSYNKLNNGVPIEILPYQDENIWKIINTLIPVFLKLGLKGPLNIQGRITKQGLRIFEMNPRFTGITGLRALMGFNEVESCVKEWLGIDKGQNQLTFNYRRFGVRQSADKSILLDRNEKIGNLAQKLNKKKTNCKRNILITGSCGYLGRNLIRQLINEDEFNIWAFHSDKEIIRSLFGDDIAGAFDKSDLRNGRIQLGNVDILLHLGFARPHSGADRIAESLEFTNELFARAVMHHIPAIINISSQSIYGQNTSSPWTEQTKAAPSMTYSQAKYATELMLKSLNFFNNQLHYTSLRLGTLAGGAEGLVEVDFLSKIVRQAYEGEDLVIQGGKQLMERFDIRDSVSAIIILLKSNSMSWKPVYNLSSGEVYSLLDIAKMVVEISHKYNTTKPKLKVIPNDTEMISGMDCLLFQKDMGWDPQHNIKDTIASLYRYFAMQDS